MGSRHARVVRESSTAALSCVIDPDERVGMAVAEQHGTRWLPDLDGSELVDAFIVASSTETHSAWVERVVALNKPVLVEKPVATEIHEVRALVEAASAAGVPLMCGFVERFNPAFLQAKEILCEPLYLHAVRRGPRAPRVRSGVAYDLAIHDVDLAIRLFGVTPHTVSARRACLGEESGSDGEDVARLHLGFADGAMAMVLASRIGQRRIRTLSIIEAGRRVEIDLRRQHLAVHRADEVVEIPTMPIRREPLGAQLEHFVDLIRGVADEEAERRSVLPAHEVIAAGLAGVPSIGASLGEMQAN